MAVLGGLFALSQWLEPVAVAALAFLAASISCHVAGNAIGTRLRANGDRPIAMPGGQPAAAATARPSPNVPATRLSQRYSLGWTIVAATAGGVLLGALGGAAWTWLASRGPIGLVHVAIGAVAFGVLGGIASFATVGFVQVMLGALWQAMKAPPRELASSSGGNPPRLP